jgi:ankyrin repeat protein
MSPRLNGLLALRVNSEDKEFAKKCMEMIDPKDVFSAVRHSKTQTVIDCLEAGFDPNTVDEHGNTLFMVACQNGNKEIGKVLLEAGANLNIKNFKGNTGLHFLYTFGYPEIAEFFICQGSADPNITNDLGLLPKQGIKH